MSNSLSFSAAIKGFNNKTEKQLDKILNKSVALLESDMQRSVPLDTGFLRATFAKGVNVDLQPLTQVNSGGSIPVYSINFLNAKFGDTISLSYGAEYAAHLEYGTATMSARGWVRSSETRWQSFVDQAVKEAG
jgi:hypothetical protein